MSSNERQELIFNKIEFNQELKINDDLKTLFMKIANISSLIKSI